MKTEPNRFKYTWNRKILLSIYILSNQIREMWIFLQNELESMAEDPDCMNIMHINQGSLATELEGAISFVKKEACEGM